MSGKPSAMRRLFLLPLFMSVLVVPARAAPGQSNACVPQEQHPGTWKIDIEASASVRCPAFDLAAGQGVGLVSDSHSLDLDVFVYDAASSELAGKSDDEAIEPFYEWKAIHSGRYYVVIRNNSGSGGAANLRILADWTDKGGEGWTGGEAIGQSRPHEPNAAVVNVYYATDRAVVGQSEKGVTYGTEPAANDSIELGIAKVSIPRAHQMGELEGPSILRLEFREDPEKHVVLLSAKEESPDNFYRRVSDRVAQSPRREALIYVPGFNVTFEEAARRTAQIAYDLGFAGAPILYSWPSHGELGMVAYNQDTRNAELSVPHLQSFLAQLAARTGVRTIHVVAHSMGNLVAVKALAGGIPGGTSAGAGSIQVREVALMAPDIDAAEFRKLAVAMRSSAYRITLYASSGDAALKASTKLAGYPRAGEGGEHIVVMPGVLDTIDCSTVDTSLLGFGHSYYADNSTILSDLFRLIRGDAAGDRFRLSPMHNAQGEYWVFAPTAR